MKYKNGLSEFARYSISISKKKSKSSSSHSGLMANGDRLKKTPAPDKINSTFKK